MAHHNHHHHRRSLGPQVMPELGHVLGHLDTRNPATIVSVVYVTAAPTFSGPVAGYTTIGAAPQPSQHDSSTSSPGQQQAGPPSELQSQNNQQSEQNGHSAQSAQSQSASSGSQSPSSPSATSADSPSSLSLASSTSPSAISPVSSSNTDSALSNIVPPTISSSPSTSASSDTASTTSSSMSTGSIIGIIAGVLIGLGLLSALGFVLYRRKLAQRDGYAKTEDEKPAMSSSGDPFGTAPFGTARAPSTRSVRTASTAPRLSLRPVTQFDPNLGRNVAGPPQQLAPSFRGGNPQPVQQRRLNDPNNPFGNHAEPSNQDGPPMSGPAAAAVSPVNAMMAGPGPNIPRGPNGPTGPNGTAHPMDKAANASFLDMHSSMSSVNSLPEPGMRRPASPTASEYSTTSAMTTGTAAGVGAAAGAMGAGRAAPGGSSGSPVHRIQLDFKPSMEDELELKAGQLVRLLHEYDDGWALCIRLDRSQQGVAPRTCLSTRPVKPRPAGQTPGGAGSRGPPPPGMRVPQQQGPPRGPPMGPPMGPMYGQQRPMSPSGRPGPPRPMSPAGGRQSPRPMSPAGGRPPNGYGGPPRPMTPTGPYGRAPAPLSPNRGRNSPGPQANYGPPPQGYPSPSGTPVGGRSRANSSSLMNGQANRASPPGPSQFNRPPPNAGPQGIPPALRSGSPGRSASPAPGGPSQARVARKPAPGQAM